MNTGLEGRQTFLPQLLQSHASLSLMILIQKSVELVALGRINHSHGMSYTLQLDHMDKKKRNWKEIR